MLLVALLQLHLVIILQLVVVLLVTILHKVPRHLDIIHRDIIHQDIGDLLQHLPLDMQKDIIHQVVIMLQTHTNLLQHNLLTPVHI